MSIRRGAHLWDKVRCRSCGRVSTTRNCARCRDRRRRDRVVETRSRIITGEESRLLREAAIAEGLLPGPTPPTPPEDDSA